MSNPFCRTTFGRKLRSQKRAVFFKPRKQAIVPKPAPVWTGRLFNLRLASNSPSSVSLSSSVAGLDAHSALESPLIVDLNPVPSLLARPRSQLRASIGTLAATLLKAVASYGPRASTGPKLIQHDTIDKKRAITTRGRRERE